MVQTTPEVLSVNGVVLNTLAKNISSITGRMRAPAHRTGNITVPGAHGDLWTPYKKFQPGSIALPMWVTGCDDNGAIPAGSTKRREFFKRVDELVTLFKDPNLLDVRWTQPDGSVRQCYAEASDVMDFTVDADPTGMVGVVLTIPGVFWAETTQRSMTASGVVTSFTPTDFQGGSAPIEDMVYVLTGPWTTPRVTFSDGSYFQYNATIAAGASLSIDCDDYVLTGAGLTPDYRLMEHDGRDAYWGALPASAAALALGGSGRTTASRFQMTGNRKFLVG